MTLKHLLSNERKLLNEQNKEQVYLECGNDNNTVMSYVDYETLSLGHDASRRMKLITSDKAFNVRDLVCLLSDERRIGIITK